MIDAQHQALFNAIDHFYSILEDHDLERDRRMSEDAVFFLRRHAVRHFADEEAYMRSIGDETYRLHKAQHEAILDELVRSAFEELCRLLSIHFIKGYRNCSFFRIDRSRVAAQEELSSMLPASDPVCSVLFNEPYGSFFIRVW